MTTGIVRPIHDGEPTTLAQYIVRCYRATPYDTGCEGGIPEDEPLGVDDGHVRAREFELSQLREMSDEEAGRRAEEEHRKNLAYKREYDEGKSGLRERYEAMLGEVYAWEDPPELRVVKTVAKDQLLSCINFDIGKGWEVPEKKTAERWRRDEIGDLERFIARERGEIEREVERRKRTNAERAVLRAEVERLGKK
jgi:hypothetical protein